MSRLTLCGTFALLIVTPVLGWAQSVAVVDDSAQPYSSSSSSNAVEVDAPSAAPTPALTAGGKPERSKPAPFKSYAVELKIGTGGIGPEIATPLNSFMNLRAAFQVFDHPLKFRTSGIYSTADLTIQNASMSVDIFPFHGSFHISPGVTVYGDNHLTSSLLVPGGANFLLGPDGYTSDPNDPVTGTARIRFGNPVSPRFTIGWGNMLPRNGRRWSVPFEIGFQYIAPPSVTINLTGSVCDNMGNCGPVNQGSEQQDLQTEINELNADLQPLRFYPIIAIGFSYKFGK